MFIDSPSVSQLSTVISQVAGPAFLLAAQAEFVGVLVSRLDRVVDRSRFLLSLRDDDPQIGLRREMPTLQKRAIFLHHAIYWSVGSGIVTSLLVILAFATAMLHFKHEYGAAIMFTLALAMFAAALIAFAREIRLAFSEIEQCSGQSTVVGKGRPVS
jgi:hypothetical protein